jgi:hypothetical protein
MKDFQILGGLIVKAKGKYFGGISALHKVLSRKRVILCPRHCRMMQKGELRFSDLSSVTATFGEEKKLWNIWSF